MAALGGDVKAFNFSEVHAIYINWIKYCKIFRAEKLFQIRNLLCWTQLLGELRRNLSFEITKLLQRCGRVGKST